MKFSVLTNAKQTEYSVTKKKLDKKEHLVVPVVMMVEGVHNGSHGPLLHLIEDLGKFPASWDGIPAVIDHPNVNGINVSANSPDILETRSVGRIFNTHVNGSKLMAEVWLETDKLSVVSPDVLSAINLKTPIEVSVGVFTEDEDTAGTWEGETYSAIARNHRPDHLALLPGAVGACSLADGCGIRANKKGGSTVDRNLLNLSIMSVKENGYRIGILDNSSDKGLNEKLDDLRELVRSLNPVRTDAQMGTVSSEYNYLIEAYDTYLIYEKESGNECKYFKQNYQFNVQSGDAEFVGDPIEVERKVEYDPVSTDIENNSNIEEKNQMEKCTPCVEKKVNELIANAAAIFTEEDRAMLQALTEDQLDKLVPKTIEVNTETVKEVNVLSEADKAALAFGHKQLKARRDAHIAGIQANTAKDLWSEASLTAMDDDTLEKVYKSVYKEPEQTFDFSLNGNNQMRTNSSKKEEALYPAGVEVK